ncbi:MAG: uracil-DNA glycosylase [Thermoprotei archaeon]|nr:MAG: uracil-DNA glycosylase [Thermoprotei archaeon]
MSKEEELSKINKEIAKCTRCKLSLYRTKPVPGEGNPYAKVMFIGEAPGRFEDLQGRPFVGAAGKLLTELLNGIGLSREEVFITNVVKCRPPNNRDPREDEIKLCSSFLERQIEIIDPDVIVTLGRHSTRYILGRAGYKVDSIMRVRGREFEILLEGRRRKVLPMLHPAAALYNPRLKNLLEEDFRKLRKMLSKSSRRTLDQYF